MTDTTLTRVQLRAIRFQVQRWIDWSAANRERDHLTTEDGTHIMALPVPYWPSHGQLAAWVATFDRAITELQPSP